MPKRKSACPNPLFLIWLEEWKREAEERGLNSKWTYAKAISSIKKYPLPLRSGKEAKILENIGNGIAEKLDKRLNEYLENGGDIEDLHRVEEESPLKRRRRTKKKENEFPLDELDDRQNMDIDVAAFSPDANYKKTNARPYIPKYRSGPYALIITLYQECQKPTYIGYMSKAELQEKAQSLSDKSMTVPDAGSHYTAWSSMGTLIEKGYVIKRSSPAKYYITDKGCQLAHQLINGKLVHNATPKKKTPNKNKNNRSPVYNGGREPLPEAGAGLLGELKELVAQLDNKKTKNNNFQSPIRRDYTTVNNNNTFPKLNTPTSNITKQIPLNNVSIQSPGRGHKLGGSIHKDRMAYYNKLQEQLNKKTSEKKTSSHTITRPISQTTPPISQTNHSKPQTVVNLDSSSVKNIINVDQPPIKTNDNSYSVINNDNRNPLPTSLRGSMVPVNVDNVLEVRTSLDYVYIMENGYMTSIKSKALVTIDDKIGLGFLIKAMKHDLETSGMTFIEDKIRTKEDKFLYAYISDRDAKELSVSPQDFAAKTASSATCNTKGSNVTKNILQTNSVPPQRLNNFDANNSDKTINATKYTESSKSVVSNFGKDNKRKKPSDTIIQSSVDYCKDVLFTLSPGMFDIMLCVDVVETSGSGRRKKEMADKLAKSGVKMDVRKLQVGDFIWVAKEKYGLGREVVLDFIIERKRMDDLASSICDGRFREQKFRLKSSCLKKPIYLVEQYGSPDHYPVPEATLRQAVMNTQVIEGFFIKETSDVYSSVDYLQVMTSQLTKLYSKKTLLAVTYDTLKTMNEHDGEKESFLQLNKQYLMTFEEFATNCNKNKVLTVSEIFAKHLMQIKGVSAERAMAIVGKYPTPKSFVSALGGCSTTKEKENLIAIIEYGKSKRKIGAAISKQIQLAYDTLNVVT